MSHRYFGLLQSSKMKSRYYLFLPLILVVAFLLAFLLRGTVKALIIIPLAKVAWLVKGYYGVIPQAAYWLAALGIALIIAILSLQLPDWEIRHRQGHRRLLPGTVREMTFWIQREKAGIFTRWHIAHLLAELALAILDRHGTEAKYARVLAGPDWNPPTSVKNYLDAALSTNYADYPKPRRFESRQLTPFDQDLESVIKYLESLLESEHDYHS
jgi:hypothetical protein